MYADRRFGLYASHLHNRLGAADLTLAAAGLGDVWEILQVALKPYPACHFVHACIEAAIKLAREHALDAAQVQEVRALVPREVVSTVCEPLQNKRRPANSYDAQFSIPYAVATALRRGRFTLDDLDDAAITDPDTLALANRVNYESDPASTFPRHYSGEVIVVTRDGRTLRRREQINRGNAERPLSDAEIVEKFRSNASRVLSPAQAQRIESLVLSIDVLADVNQLASGLAAAEIHELSDEVQ